MALSVGLGEIMAIIRQVMWWEEKTRLSERLRKIIDKSLTEVLVSLEEFIDNFAMCYGSAIVYSCIFEPQNPETKAKHLSRDLEFSYMKLKEALAELAERVDAHRDTFREVLSKEDWFILEGYIHEMKKETPNWKHLLELLEYGSRSKRRSKSQVVFIDTLNKELSEFTCKENLHELEKFLKKSLSVLSSTDLIKCFYKCINTKERKRRKILRLRR